MKNILWAVVCITALSIWSISFASNNTGSVFNTSSSNKGWTWVCSSINGTTIKQIQENSKSIKTNIKELHGKHKGRIRQYIDKKQRERAHDLNNANRKEIKLLHKKLADQYYSNPIALSSSSYIDQMVTLRKSFFDAIQPLIASGKVDEFTTFKSEYLTMFKINRWLKYQNITQRYTIYQSCGVSIKPSVDKIKETVEKEHDKYDHEAKKGNPAKQQKKVNKLKDQLKKLAEKYEKKWSSVANIIKTALDELDEDDGDNEPNDK